MTAPSFHRRAVRVLILVLFLLASSWTQPVQAQESLPVKPDVQPQAGPPPQGAMVDTVTGKDFAASESSIERSDAMLNSGGPDDYGYTWSDSVTYNWISASGGSTASLSNTSYQNFWVKLPFNFKYYENVYSGLYIARSGYLAFSTSYSYDDQQYPPDKNEPNNVIAPYWSPTYLASSSRVYYRSFGTAPNRYFVVQWNQVKGGSSSDTVGRDDTFTYEAILYENGNILFQYQTMTYSGGWWCAGVGIEDSSGGDGLNYDQCYKIANNTAVRFTRPAAASRVKLEAYKYGSLVAAGHIAQVPVRIRNTGDLGNEKYDLQTTCGWPISFQVGSMGEALVDTDMSGYPDTGWMAQGEWKTIVVNLTAPSLGNVGDNIGCYVTVVPMQNAPRARTFQVGAAIPAPFAQVFVDLGNGGVGLDINEPDAMATFRNNVYGETPAVAEAPNGNLIYAWSNGRSLGNVYVWEIYYSIRNRNGGVVLPPTRLTNLSGSTTYTSDWYPAIAVAPNGTIGIVWYRYKSTTSNTYNYNIYYARLNSAGTLLGSVVNITNLTAYGSYNTNNFKRVYDPVIAATRDNRFVLSWYQYYYTNYSSYISVRDIFMASYGTGGSQVMAPTNLTNDAPGDTDSYYYPGLTAVGANRVLLTYYRSSYPNVDIYYQVRNSAGSVIKSATDLSNDDNSNHEYYSDAVELSDGNILVAWRNWPIRYIILDSTYNQIAPSQALDIYGDTISVTADHAGNGIIQAQSYGDNNISYALVNSNASILTPGLVTHFSPQGYNLSYLGNAITSHTIAPTMPNTDLYLDGPSNWAVLPEVATRMQVNLGNLGAATASTITITMSASAGVNISAPDPSASCVAEVCTWTLASPTLAFLGSGVLSFDAAIPSSPIGTAYPLELHISSIEVDGDLTNNDLTINLVSAVPFYLPAIFH